MCCHKNSHFHFFKVSQITGRMAEVDDNLNYLLGRLSLVTHEFNQIKTGLGAALDNIRSSFQIVQNKIEGKAYRKSCNLNLK